jgi:hypothetical protein
MGGADGIAAHGLEDFHLPLHAPVINSHSETAEVLVVARALDFYTLSVQEKTVIGIEIEPAHSQGCLKAVNRSGA